MNVMLRRHMPSVIAIESASFAIPWSEEDFIRCLRQRNCFGMVAEENDQVVGYMIYQLRPDRVQLINMAVDHLYRRQGVGRAMLGYLIGKLRSGIRDTIAADTREVHGETLKFFEACGFDKLAYTVSRGSGWYRVVRADAMSREIVDAVHASCAEVAMATAKLRNPIKPRQSLAIEAIENGRDLAESRDRELLELRKLLTRCGCAEVAAPTLVVHE